MEKCEICGKEVKTKSALKAHNTRFHVRVGKEHMDNVVLEVLRSMQEQLKDVQTELESVKKTQGETKEESERKLTQLRQTIVDRRGVKQKAMNAAPIVEVFGDTLEDIPFVINNQRFIIKSGVMNSVPTPVKEAYDGYKKAILLEKNVRAFYMSQGNRVQGVGDVAAQVESLRES
jgi:hypothetical protein